MPLISNPTRVVELDLSQNCFVLPRNALQELTRLRKLGLAEMEIRTLPGLPERLEELDISGNGMAKIPVQVTTCHCLVKLSIQRNRIESLAALSRLRQLNYLNAADNCIALLQGLENLHSLYTLIVDNNRVKDTKQIALLSDSVQFLSLKNTPVLRFLTTCPQLPSHFTALQDGQLLGPGYERKSSEKRQSSPVKPRVSVGLIDLAKPDNLRIRSQTPDVSSTTGSTMSQVFTEFAALKAQNRALSAKIVAMESHFRTPNSDFDQFLLMEILAELGVEVNEFSFSLNKPTQLIDVVKDRERERGQLRQENEALRAELESTREALVKALSKDMIRCDMESQIWELTEKVRELEEEKAKLKGIIEKKSRKLEGFEDLKERNREMMRMHSLEIDQNTQLQQLLAQSSHSQKPSFSAASKGRQSPGFLLPRPSKGRNSSVRADRGPHSVQRILKPDEYFQKLQLCCDLLESHPLT